MTWPVGQMVPWSLVVSHRPGHAFAQTVGGQNPGDILGSSIHTVAQQDMQISSDSMEYLHLSMHGTGPHASHSSSQNQTDGQMVPNILSPCYTLNEIV